MMEIETKTLELSVSKHAAEMLFMLAAATNGSVNNMADRALRLGLSQIADERAEKLAKSRGDQ